jgi:hypothetical protein
MSLTPKDLLQLSGAFAISIVAVFLAIVLFELAMTLKEVRRTARTAGDIADIVHSVVSKPLAIITQVQEAVKGLLGRFSNNDEAETPEEVEQSEVEKEF